MARFADVPEAPKDPILGISELFLADTSSDKMNLGVVRVASDATRGGRDGARTRRRRRATANDSKDERLTSDFASLDADRVRIGMIMVSLRC